MALSDGSGQKTNGQAERPSERPKTTKRSSQQKKTAKATKKVSPKTNPVRFQSLSIVAPQLGAFSRDLSEWAPPTSLSRRTERSGVSDGSGQKTNGQAERPRETTDTTNDQAGQDINKGNKKVSPKPNPVRFQSLFIVATQRGAVSRLLSEWAPPTSLSRRTERSGVKRWMRTENERPQRSAPTKDQRQQNDRASKQLKASPEECFPKNKRPQRSAPGKQPRQKPIKPAKNRPKNKKHPKTQSSSFSVPIHRSHSARLSELTHV